MNIYIYNGQTRTHIIQLFKNKIKTIQKNTEQNKKNKRQ